MKTIIQSILASIICISIGAAQATAVKDMTKVENALAAALEHKTIAAGGDKMKLYSIYGSVDGDRTSWVIVFFDGAELQHSISINGSGKLSYSSRDKGSFSLFKDVDFTKVAKPADVILPGLVEKGMKVLNALELKPDDSGKMYINYTLRNHYKDKATGIHHWSMAVPTGDGTAGKRVTFANGELDTLVNSPVKKK